MELVIEKITPKKAEQYLNCNKLNRKLRDGGARYIDMREAA